MSSPKSLKRTYSDADLENTLPSRSPVNDRLDGGPNVGAIEREAVARMATTEQERLASPAPSQKSSSTLSDISTQATPNAPASTTGTKRPKLTFAEKEAKRLHKEARDRQKVEEKARKEQEKEAKDRQKADEKAMKEEEKRDKDL